MLLRNLLFSTLLLMYSCRELDIANNPLQNNPSEMQRIHNGEVRSSNIEGKSYFIQQDSTYLDLRWPVTEFRTWNNVGDSGRFYGLRNRLSEIKDSNDVIKYSVLVKEIAEDFASYIIIPKYPSP